MTYVVIEDLDSFDCYSVMSKRDYKKIKEEPVILYTGSAEECNQWVLDHPHPNANDYKVYYDDKLDSESDIDHLFI